MKETKSIEDYLEAIYLLSKEKDKVRVKDIANFLSVKPPSVTGALKKLALYGYIEHLPYRGIILKPKGEKIGKSTWEKHKLIFIFLNDVLKVSKEKAYKEACLIEHCISNETKVKIEKFLEKLKQKK